MSHDGLTSMLPADWSGHRRLERAGRLLFVWEQGCLMLDGALGLGLFQPGTPACLWVLPRAVGVDARDPSDPTR